MKFRRLGTVVVALGAAMWLWLAVAGAADQTEGVLIYVSSTSDGTVDGIDFKDEDILVYNSDTDAWAMHFDGSDVGLNGSDINALHILDDNNDTTLDPILMSVKNQFLPDIGAMVDDSDVLRFTPTSLGSNTAGTFSIELDGSDVGLTTNNEEIDALTVRSDGRLVISTNGSFRVPATGGGDLRGQDEDLISLATSGTTWDLYFDGSDVGLTKSTEDVWGAWIDARTGDLYLTTKDEFSVPGSPINPLTGDQEDIILFTGAKGETTSGTFSDFWDGDTHRFAGQRLDGMSLVFLNAAPDARDDAFTTDEDTPLVGEDLFADNGDGADSDADGDPFFVIEVNGNSGNVGGPYLLPSGASLLVAATGSMDYDPTGAFDVLDEGDSVDDTFTYTIEDQPVMATDTATVTVTVTGVNDPPMAHDDTDSTDEDTGTSTDVLANDTDVDGDDNPSNFSLDSIDSVVVAGLTTDPNLTAGSVSIVANQVAFDPATDFDELQTGESATVTIDYTMSDDSAAPSSATLVITVSGIDDAPVAVNDSATVTEDDPATAIDVLGNDTDVDGGTKLIGSASDPAGGTVAVTGGGTGLTYLPDPDFCNDGTPTDDFTYTLNGGSTATVSVTVTCVDDAPVAVNDSATVTEDDSATAIDVLGNDTDVDGGPKLIGSASDPAGGTVVITGGGTGLTYLPDPDFCNDGTPTDDFTYTLNGGSTATVSVTVTCVNDAPVVTPSGSTSSFRTGDPAVIVDGGIAVSDVDDLTLASATVTIANLQDTGDEVLAATASGAITAGDISYAAPTLTISPSGGAPLADFQAVLQSVTYLNTTDPVTELPRTIEFVVNDGLADSNTGQVTVNVVDNEAPVITSNGGGDTASVNAAENQTAVTDVNAGDDSDSEGSGLTYSLTGGADQAFFSIDASSGVVTFDAAPDFESPADSDGNNDYEVQVTVTDSGGLTDSQDITVTVTDVNDAPVITSDDGGPTAAVNAAENQTAVTDVDSTDQDGDTEGSGLTYSLTGGADQGAFSINLNTGVVTFNPAPDFETPGDSDGDNDYEVQVTVTDSGGLTDVQDITVTVTNLNEAPTANDDIYDSIGNVGIDVPAGAGVLANDADDDASDIVGTNVLVSAFDATSAGSGNVNVAGDGSFTYTPAPGFTGVDTFGYTIMDDGGLTGTATVTVTVSTPIWFIDASAAGPGDGRLASPFQGLVGAGNSFDANAADDPGDFIFLADGSYTGGLTLLDNQELIGDGSSSDLATILGITVPPHSNTLPTFSGSDPQITTTISGTDAITVGTGNTIRGLTIGNTTGDAIAGTGFGTLTVLETSINGQGQALDLANGTLAASFEELSSTSGARNIRLDAVSGSLTHGTGSMSGATNEAVRITNSSLSFTYTGAISNAGSGIVLTDNSGTMSFGGGMTLNTGADPAFTAMGGGTVNVTGVNRIGNTTPLSTTAINIQGTALGSLGVTFQDVSVNAGTVGIDIDGGGTTGFFTITGVGTTAGSGGTIQNTTQNGILIENTNNVTLNNVNLTNAADEAGGTCTSTSFAGCTASLELNTVANVSIDNMAMSGSDEHGLFGSSVTNLDISDSSFTNLGNGTDENGIFVVNLLGTSAAGLDSVFDNVTVTGAADNGIQINNSTATNAGTTSSPDKLTVENSAINGSGVGGIQAITDTGGTGNLRLDVNLTDFSSNASVGIATNANGGDLQTNITNNVIVHGAGTQFRAVSGQGTSTGDLFFTVTGNTMTANNGGAGTGPAIIAYANNGSGTVNGTIGGAGGLANILTNNTPAGTPVAGVSIINNGAGSSRIVVNNNAISVIDGFGVIANTQGTNTGSGHFHLIGNTITVSGADFANTAVSPVNSSSSGTQCLNISGNSLSTSPAGFFDIVLAKSNTTNVYQVQQTGVTTTGPWDGVGNNQQVEIDINNAQASSPGGTVVNPVATPAAASFTPGTCTSPSSP